MSTAPKTWAVQLSAEHPGYQRVELKRRHPQSPDYEVVVVPTQALLDLWSRDTSYFLPPVDQWKPEKRNGIRDFLDPADPGFAEMPVVSVHARTVVEWSWWPPFRRIHELPVVAFTNGRHRARYLAAAGAQHLPVEVTQRSAPKLKALCGL